MKRTNRAEAARSEWTSALGVRELADVFRSTSETLFNSRGRRWLALLDLKSLGAAGKMRFFTPEPDDSPFAQLEAQPDFSVAVSGPQGGRTNGALPVVIHMYVDDGEGDRRVQFVVPYGKTLSRTKAEEHLERYDAALRDADPHATRR